MFGFGSIFERIVDVKHRLLRTDSPLSSEHPSLHLIHVSIHVTDRFLPSRLRVVVHDLLSIIVVPDVVLAPLRLLEEVSDVTTHGLPAHRVFVQRKIRNLLQF